MMDWIETYRPLQVLEDPVRQRLAALKPLSIPAGHILFHPGDTAEGFLILLSGRVDVFLMGPTGREILLYTVGRGDTCVQTTLGLLGGTAYSGEGVAATDVSAVLLPEADFAAVMETSPAFCRFVFAAFASRMQDMMHLIERVAFVRIENRLAAALLDLADGNLVTATHQELAARIGSAREVVSRRLEALSKDGLVQTERGAIRLLDLQALRHAAAAASSGD